MVVRRAGGAVVRVRFTTSRHMKISKHLHSCLLVEEAGKVILVDPGNYTAMEGALNINLLNQLDDIVITHEHTDHMDIPTIKQLVAKFPNVRIFSNNAVKDILGNEKIEVQTASNEHVQMSPVPHEKIWFGSPVPNLMVTLFGRLTTPGDSHSFTVQTEILALPVQAPWGSTTRAVELAIELKPKVIIPIHDWHWKDEARKGFYQRLHEYFGENGIDFKAVETGDVIEV